MNAVKVLTLFKLPEPEPPRPAEDAVVAVLREPGRVNDAVAGAMGWLRAEAGPDGAVPTPGRRLIPNSAMASKSETRAASPPSLLRGATRPEPTP